jgi:hypothetical protein
MLRAATRLRVSRLAALAVALVLSGAGRVAGEVAERGQHRCMCPRGAHDCACPTCLEAERRRLEDEAAKAPPCHRAALARRAADHRRAPGAPLPTPCLRSACGGGDGGRIALPSPETFLLPPAAALPFTERAQRLFEPPRRSTDLPARPPVPPPRPPRLAA